MTNLRAALNLHVNSNPDNLPGNGAHVVDLRTTPSFYVVESSIFRNVKGVYVVAVGTILPGVHELAWTNNSVDLSSTGAPLS